MARRNRNNNATKVAKQQEEKQVKKLTTKNEIMKRAHEMCREFKSAGFKFDYHVQLSLNMKYLYEISNWYGTAGGYLMGEKLNKRNNVFMLLSYNELVMKAYLEEIKHFC